MYIYIQIYIYIYMLYTYIYHIYIYYIHIYHIYIIYIYIYHIFVSMYVFPCHFSFCKHLYLLCFLRNINTHRKVSAIMTRN